MVDARRAGAALAAASVLGGAGPAVAESARWSAELTAASEAVSKGIGKSDGRPQLAGRLELEASHLIFGAWVGNIETSEGADAEAHLYAGAGRDLGPARVAFRAFYKAFPGTAAGVQDDHLEFRVDAEWDAGPVELRQRIEYAPDSYARTREAWWFETMASRALTPRLTASAGLGRREQTGSADYTAWNAGLAWALTDDAGVDLRWYDSDGHEHGERYEGRLVAELTVGF